MITSKLLRIFLKKWKKYDLIFYVPCYFHTLFLQRALISQGFKVTTIIPPSYPPFLDWYGEEECIRIPSFEKSRYYSSLPFKTHFKFLTDKLISIYVLYLLSRSSTVMSLGHVLGSFRGVFLKHLVRTRQYCFISSCALDARMSTWQNVENCDICENCGLRQNNKHYCQSHRADTLLMERLRFSSGEITSGAFPYTEVPHEIVTPFISCDPNYFHPLLEPPHELTLCRDSPGQILILHSYAQDDNRLHAHGMNPIKGTEQILNAVSRIKQDGIDVKLINITGYHQSDVRYLQVQADICVDELRYGWFGSTPLECASLGVPTIVYINYLFHKYWSLNYPHLVSSFPFLSADVTNIYDVLKLLCLDHSLRDELKLKSLSFARSYLDPTSNAQYLAEHLQLNSSIASRS